MLDEEMTDSCLAGVSDCAHEQRGQEYVGLFDDTRDDVINIHVPLKYRICNYHCSYCYLGTRNTRIPQTILEFLDRLIPQLERIKRPTHVIFATDGEISVVPPLWPYLRRISHLRSVALVSLFSNLSGDFAKMLDGVDTDRVSLVASYHREQMSENAEKHQQFLTTIAALRERCRRVVVSYILHQDHLSAFAPIRSELIDKGISVFAYPLIPVKDKAREYTSEEWGNVNMILDTTNQSRWINHFMSGGRHPSLKCTAGCDLVEIANDGSMLPCYMLREERLGNILGEGMPPVVRTSDVTCPHGGCSCNWAVGFSDVVRSECTRIDSLYGFVARK